MLVFTGVGNSEGELNCQMARTTGNLRDYVNQIIFIFLFAASMQSV